MQEMKIKIKSPEHSIQVQKALFEQGYGWGFNAGEYQQLNAKALYCYEGGSIYWASSDNQDYDYFDGHRLPEYHLNSSGEFVKGPEPTLQEKLQAKINSTTGRQYHGVVFGYAPSYELEQRSDGDWDMKPIGIRSRKEVRQERIKEILGAMLRYVEANETIPDEWIDELVDEHEILKRENNY